LEKQDQLTLRFVASLLVSEYFVYSSACRRPEVRSIGDALRKILGTPFSFADNLTFLACELARHDMSTLDKTGLFDGKSTGEPWLTIGCDLPIESNIWQWNPKLERPDKKAKKLVTPEGGTNGKNN
jgi:hypothetical protein